MNFCPTYEVKIYIGGDLREIECACREFCLNGLCVTVTPTLFVYTGAAESGACVGLINYPRLPSDPDKISAKALDLARYLISRCSQRSCSVVTSYITHYLTNPEIKTQQMDVP